MDGKIILLALLLCCCFVPSLHSAWLAVACPTDWGKILKTTKTSAELKAAADFLTCTEKPINTIPGLVSCAAVLGVFIWGFLKN